ncbi:MAG TPA: hypothetical protein PKN00_22345 [Sedimentisphaerales bacterium]|jgi:hypothetical protein|nr:hypothetical protein [Sedimentisphaerales bacterium]
MSEALSESAIVHALAQDAARRITRKVIADLQRMKHTLSGDDSELKTTWDEICVQIQSEQSFCWDVYDETVRAVVSGHVAKLAAYEREAIWLQSDAGGDWDCREPQEREAYPVCDGDVVDYLIREYIYAEAGRWSNARIRAYIERHEGA